MHFHFTVLWGVHVVWTMENHAQRLKAYREPILNICYKSSCLIGPQVKVPDSNWLVRFYQREKVLKVNGGHRVKNNINRLQLCLLRHILLHLMFFQKVEVETQRVVFISAACATWEKDISETIFVLLLDYFQNCSVVVSAVTIKCTSS